MAAVPADVVKSALKNYGATSLERRAVGARNARRVHQEKSNRTSCRFALLLPASTGIWMNFLGIFGCNTQKDAPIGTDI